MKTKLMGILNVTPDSFYDQGRWFDFSLAVQHGIQLMQHGADLIDIGGESTRPGAPPVSEQEELQRVIPVIRALREHVSVPLSIDTMKPKVAEAALLAGATFINDVSGFRNPHMQSLAASSGVKICVMHMHETPLTMQNQPSYPQGIILFLLDWFQKKINELCKAGIQPHQIILDPGIGFGKTIADNLEILHNLQKIKALGFPILLGISRKSFMGKLLQHPPSGLLPATLTINMLVIKDVDILRVHDVGEHRDLLHILEDFKTS
jgi:dihydropteroate synthase